MLPEEQLLATEELLINGEPVPDNEISPQNGQTVTAGSSTTENQRIEMEIRTSSLPELAAWCRSLGLSEGGTRADLSRRLREYFQLPEPGSSITRGRIINVESAQTSEYFTIEVTDEEYARLKGDVSLSLIDNNTIHRIKADEILFNRTRSILTARGQVVYEKEEGNIVETFRGENITVNINDWSSIFLDGTTEHMLESDGTAYRFSGMVISRSNDDVTVLNQAVVTNAKNEEALWSVSASRIWLLPGSDFAIFNAILRVGEIPVFYLPFFYYPTDEMIFHPVIGYRSREGGFVQTTTYILGRPKASSSEASTITRILGDSNNMEKERHGLFLRSTGRMVKDPESISLKALLDYYANMGTYIGLDLYVPKTEIFNPIDLSLGVGITRTVSRTSSGYTPYAPDYDGTFDWNHSNLLSFSVPFRYRMLMKSSISLGSRFNLSWNFPYYSDPYVNIDFMDRSESMDWISMLSQGEAVSESGNQSDNEIGSYQWYVSGNYNPSLPGYLDPYISRVYISNISTSLDFKMIRDNEIFQNNRNSPGRYFYAPDKYTIFNISGSINGAPWTFGGPPQVHETQTASEIKDPFNGIGSPISPWNNTVTFGQDRIKTLSAGSSGEELIPPVLNINFNIPAEGNIKYDIDYQITPTGTSEVQFLSGTWNTYKQVNWGEIQSLMSSFGGNSNINFRMNHSSGLFSNVVTLSGSATWRDYNYINTEIFRNANTGEIDESKIEDMRRHMYSQTFYSTFYEYNGSVRPFIQNTIFGQSNLSFNLRGTLVRSKRYAGGDGPRLTPQWGSWVKEQTKDGEFIAGLNRNRLSANIAANIFDHNQHSISLSVDLPPLDTIISTNAIFKYRISETKLNFRISRSDGNGRFIFEPVYLTETLRFLRTNSFTFHMVIEPEEDNDITTITSALSFQNFRFSFMAEKTQRSRFITDNLLGGKWEQYGEPALYPKEVSLGYNHNFFNTGLLRNHMDFAMNINTSLSFNLLQYTNSNFQIEFGFDMKITNFLDLRFSATSENNVLFRYFKGFSGMEHLTFMYPDGPQNNIFTDLFDSFNFLNEDKRRRTGFKLKRFDLKAIHYLGDWRAEFGISMYPFMNSSRSIPKYEITTDVSFIVQWRPITEIKTDIRYEGRNNRWTTIR